MAFIGQILTLNSSKRIPTKSSFSLLSNTHKHYRTETGKISMVSRLASGIYPVLVMRSAIAVYRPNWIPAEQVFNIIMIDYPSSTNPNWISTAEKYTLAGVKKTNGD